MEFDLGTIRGIITLVLLFAFLGICVWAYSPGQKKNFDQASRLPFDDLEDDANNEENISDEKHKNVTSDSANSSLKSENSSHE